MRRPSIRQWWLPVVVLVLVSAGASPGYAQSRAGCQEPQRPSVGVAVGKSSPYFDVARDAVTPAEQTGSIMVRGGFHFAARGQASISGPVLFRVEGSVATWDVERLVYSPDTFQLISTTSIGHVAVRQLGAAVGLRGGRPSVCWLVLAGGGLYSLTFRDATLRRPGVSITAGIEVPTGERGAVQVDVQVHIIDTKSRSPVSSSAALAAALVAGWAYRF